jgi:hypothetical protein
MSLTTWNSDNGYEGKGGWKFGQLSSCIRNIVAWKKYLESVFVHVTFFENEVVFEDDFLGM